MSRDTTHRLGGLTMRPALPPPPLLLFRSFGVSSTLTLIWPTSSAHTTPPSPISGVPRASAGESECPCCVGRSVGVYPLSCILHPHVEIYSTSPAGMALPSSPTTFPPTAPPDTHKPTVVGKLYPCHPHLRPVRAEEVLCRSTLDPPLRSPHSPWSDPKVSPLVVGLPLTPRLDHRGHKGREDSSVGHKRPPRDPHTQTSRRDTPRVATSAGPVYSGVSDPGRPGTLEEEKTRLLGPPFSRCTRNSTLRIVLHEGPCSAGPESLPWLGDVGACMCRRVYAPVVFGDHNLSFRGPSLSLVPSPEEWDVGPDRDGEESRGTKEVSLSAPPTRRGVGRDPRGDTQKDAESPPSGVVERRTRPVRYPRLL